MVIRKASVFGFYRRRRPIYFGVDEITGSSIFLSFFRCVYLIYLPKMGNEKIKKIFLTAATFSFPRLYSG